MSATGPGPAGYAGIGLFTVLVVALVAFNIVVIVFWILSIIDIVKRPDWQFKLAGHEKVLWLVLVIVISLVSLLYWFWIRKDVAAVEQAARAGAYGPGHLTMGGWEPGPPMMVVPPAPPGPGWHP